MKDPDKAFVCGACNVAVVAPSNPEPSHQIICPRCGARDDYQQVFKIIKEHAGYLLKRARERGIADLNRKLGRPSRGATPNDTDEPFFKWRIKD